jgi:hypothetical protein
MKLTENTLNVLTNYASINPNIVIEQGNILKTVSGAKNIMAFSTVDTVFPSDFGIYDLNEFLNAIDMIDQPEFLYESENKSVIIRSEDKTCSIKYFFSDPKILVSPSKDIDMPECEVEFELGESDLNNIKRASSTFRADTLVVTPDNGELVLSVRDIEDKTSNSYSIRVSPSKCPEKDFRFVFQISNFKFISGDLRIRISSQLIGEFAIKNSESKYWVALEKSSTFNK